MLDECKGDKFFEILAFFSNVVLKKVIAARQGNESGAAVARKLATATTLSSDKQASLIPLAIAHKAALVNILRRKDEQRRRFTNFEELLDSKAAEINRRIKKCKATPRAQKYTVPEKDAAAVKKQLKDSWVGNQKWVDTILHGDGAEAEDVFLSLHFKEVWPMVEQGRNLEEAAPEIGLLENLQLRVQEQQTRLQKWRAFHEKLRQEKPVEGSRGPKTQTTARVFKFDVHLKLQLQPPRSLSNEAVQREPLRPEYQDIIADMDSELLRISQAKPNRSARPVLSRAASSFGGSRSPVRRRASRSEPVSMQPIHSVPEQPAVPVLSQKGPPKRTLPSRPRRIEHTATPLDSEATLVGLPSTVISTIQTEAQPVEPPRVEHDKPPSEETNVHLDTQPIEPSTEEHARSPEETSPLPAPTLTLSPPHSRSPSPQPSSHWPSEPPVLEPPPMNSEDALAEQIIFSIGNATPSPVKKQPRLSLLERTRLSMAHTSAFAPISESPSLDPPPLPELPPVQPALDRQASLIERTRLSMAAMSHNQSKPKKDKRRSSARQSLFPVNQFDTPRSRKSIQAIEEAHSSGSTTPKEVLFSDGIDYEHVFKSRPKIAQSPIFSPALHGDTEGGAESGFSDRRVSSLKGVGVGYEDEDDGDEFDEGVTGVDLGDVDGSEDEDGFTQAWGNVNSPLKGKGKMFS